MGSSHLLVATCRFLPTQNLKFIAEESRVPRTRRHPDLATVTQALMFSAPRPPAYLVLRLYISFPLRCVFVRHPV